MTVSAPAASPTTTSSAPDTVVVEGRKEIQSFNDPDGPSFSDVLDIINPLQHIPIINTIYQHLTGDKEGAVADMAGGMLWGGPIGLGAAVANLVIESITGKSISDNALAAVGVDDQDGEKAVAEADPAALPGSQAAPVALAGPPPVQLMDLSPIGTAEAAESLPSAVTGSAASQTSQTQTSMGQTGPASVGGFLVFGGPAATDPASAGSLAQASQQIRTQKAAGDALQAMAPRDGGNNGQPIGLTPPVPARTAEAATAASPRGAPVTQPGLSQAAAVLAAQAAQAQPAATQTATLATPQAKTGINRAGDFLVFGSGEAAASSLPPVSAAPGPQRPAQTAAAPEGAASQTPAGQTAAAPMPLTPANQNAVAQQVASSQMAARAASRAYAPPPRRSAEAPQGSLPMPTTGPAAVPGSQAPSQAQMNSQGSSNAWFASAFSQAMDKYDRSRTLLDANQSAASSTVH